MAGGGGGFAACWPQRWVNFKARYLLGCVLLPGCATSLFLELEMCRTEKQQLIKKKGGKKPLNFNAVNALQCFLLLLLTCSINKSRLTSLWVNVPVTEFVVLGEKQIFTSSFAEKVTTFSQFEGCLALLPGPSAGWPCPGCVCAVLPVGAPVGQRSMHFQLSAANLVCVSELFLNGHLSLSPGPGCNTGALERLLEGSFQILMPIFSF